MILAFMLAKDFSSPSPSSIAFCRRHPSDKKRQGKESVCPPYCLYTRDRVSLGTERNSAMYQMITMQLENSAPIPPSIPLINKENSGPGEI